MIATATHEIRMAARRAAWPLALALHAAAASLFVILWGPTGGVPLWEATVLQQLVVVDRIAAAVLLTWLVTFVFADDTPDPASSRRIADWAALFGYSPAAIFRSRAMAAACAALVFVAVAIPALVAAGALSAATGRDVAAQAGALLGFAWLGVSLTAAMSVAVRDRVGIWCWSMTLTAIAALATRMFDTALTRGAIPAAAGFVILLAASWGLNVRGTRATH